MSVPPLLVAVYLAVFLSVFFIDVTICLHLIREDEILIFNLANKLGKGKCTHG